MTLEQLIAKLDVKIRIAPPGKCIEIPQHMAAQILEALKNIPDYRNQETWLRTQMQEHRTRADEAEARNKSQTIEIM